MLVAVLLIDFLEAYAALGGLFAIAFVSKGVVTVDAGARDAGIAFRLIILPGVVALWPVLLRQWIRGRNGGLE